MAPSSRGLGHHPLKVETRIRIPLGLPVLYAVQAAVSRLVKRIPESQLACCVRAKSATPATGAALRRKSSKRLGDWLVPVVCGVLITDSRRGGKLNLSSSWPCGG